MPKFVRLPALRFGPGWRKWNPPCGFHPTGFHPSLTTFGWRLRGSALLLWTAYAGVFVGSLLGGRGVAVGQTAEGQSRRKGFGAAPSKQRLSGLTKSLAPRLHYPSPDWPLAAPPRPPAGGTAASECQALCG